MSTALLRRNKRARDFKGFESAIKVPVTIGAGGFVMPANGRLGISLSNAAAAGQVRLLAGTRTLAFGALNQLQIAGTDWFEKGTVINVQSDVIGIVRLFIYDEWMTPYQIGSRTF